MQLESRLKVVVYLYPEMVEVEGHNSERLTGALHKGMKRMDTILHEGRNDHSLYSLTSDGLKTRNSNELKIN